MIRKPDAKEFRESTAVSTLRDARTLAVEGGRGIGQGTASLLKWWFIIMMGFGFVMSVVTNIGAFGILLLLGSGAAWLAHSRKKASHREAVLPARVSPLRMEYPEDVAIAGNYDLSVGDVGRRAAKFAVPAILLFPTSGMLTFMAPLTLFGIVLLALAILTVARLSGERAVVRYDSRTLIVRGLLGEATMMWEDVQDVRIRKAAFYNLPVLFTSGSRRNIVVTAAVNRLGGPQELLIPYPLLGLGKEGLVELVGILISLQAHAPATVIDALKRKTSDRSQASSAADSAAAPFDADAIMARHLADREQVVAIAHPDMARPGQPKVFGRKVARS